MSTSSQNLIHFAIRYCYVLRPFAPATACRKYSESSNGKALYLWLQFKTCNEENIHFWMGLSADTTEESTAEWTQKFPSNQCCGPPLPVGGGGGGGAAVATSRIADGDSTWVAREPS